MARLADRLPENVAGRFFVDDSCIDCDACRQIAPHSFGRSDPRAQSYVAAQPADAAAEHRALMALVACPTASIGTSPKLDPRAAITAFPEPVEEEVFYCGWHSADSYGASSYLIVRPDGNVLVDSPRASRPLLDRIAALGGVRLMFLTHRDDIADHAVFARHFGCTRIMHADDAGRLPIEHRIEGREPIALTDDLKVIPVPGHTRGSQALLYRDTFLFTGDHLWWDEDLERLDAGRDVCWWSWPEQLRSLARLRHHRFRWVLPGHGRRFGATSTDTMQNELTRTLRALKVFDTSGPRENT
jgi:glyoxylase-like metal-dependent hydrolase (beta-lactamase superfamily II)/ferredoxin